MHAGLELEVHYDIRITPYVIDQFQPNMLLVGKSIQAVDFFFSGATARSAATIVISNDSMYVNKSAIMIGLLGAWSSRPYPY